MGEATLCPALLLASPDHSADEIDAQLLRVAEQHIDRCMELGVQLFVSEAVLARVMELFPWHTTCDDPIMRQRVSIWRQAVLLPLRKHARWLCCDLRSEFGVGGEDCPIVFDSTLSTTWAGWLVEWGVGGLVGARSVRGIGSSQVCVTNGTTLQCAEFTIVRDTNDWHVVLHPWYHRYPRTLPASGDMRFVPPGNWQTGPLRRGERHGYVDSAGHEWVWDRMHGDHWDVQDPRSNAYRRVTPQGEDLDAP